ncbi:MAG: hypothetical protein JRJ85_01660 [Deltaproteobacteria bacterium]|nr:hypothetical protein [Deltaproteobacteria bacterium]
MVTSYEQRGSIISSINLFLTALLVLLAAGWSFVQKGCHWHYQKEANHFFQKIEAAETKYKNINTRYLLFNFEKSIDSFKKLKIKPEDAKYYNYSVEELDDRTLRITAHLKPDILKKWYIHNPKTKITLIYEKRAGEKGELQR